MLKYVVLTVAAYMLVEYLYRRLESPDEDRPLDGAEYNLKAIVQGFFAGDNHQSDGGIYCCYSLISVWLEYKNAHVQINRAVYHWM